MDQVVVTENVAFFWSFSVRLTRFSLQELVNNNVRAHPPSSNHTLIKIPKIGKLHAALPSLYVSLPFFFLHILLLLHLIPSFFLIYFLASPLGACFPWKHIMHGSTKFWLLYLLCSLIRV